LQLVGELTEKEALAAPRLGDQRGDGVDLDGEAKSLERLSEAAMSMQRGARRVAPEGMRGQAEVAKQRVSHGLLQVGGSSCERGLACEVRRGRSARAGRCRAGGRCAIEQFKPVSTREYIRTTIRRYYSR